MKKVKIDIPLELYTDNVRKIIERSLYDLDAEPPYIASYLCDPKFTEKDLETALHLLEKAKTETTKQNSIYCTTNCSILFIHSIAMSMRMRCMR